MRLTPRACGLAALVALSACDEADAPGSLTVAWRTGQSACDEVGVVRVRAELYRFDSADAAARADADCRAGTATLADVPAGEYTLRLAGLDDDGCWTHEASDPRVRVPAGGNASLEPLPLLRRQRPLRVRWPFANELDCQGNGVEQVLVKVEVEDLFSAEYPFVCPGLAADIDDPNRPRGRTTVQVRGYDGSGRAVAEGSIELPPSVYLTDPCAPAIEARVELSACGATGCGVD